MFPTWLHISCKPPHILDLPLPFHNKCNFYGSQLPEYKNVYYLTLFEIRYFFHLVNHQTHRNEWVHDLKWSKILFNCKRDSRNTQKIEFFQDFQMTSRMFLYIVGVITISKLIILKTFQRAPPMSNRVNIRIRKWLTTFSKIFVPVDHQHNREMCKDSLVTQEISCNIHETPCSLYYFHHLHSIQMWI